MLDRQEAERWKDPIWSAVLKRLKRGGPMTAGAIADEVGVPPEQCDEFEHLIRYFVEGLRRRGVIRF
jgi:hypothetical protein